MLEQENPAGEVMAAGVPAHERAFEAVQERGPSCASCVDVESAKVEQVVSRAHDEVMPRGRDDCEGGSACESSFNVARRSRGSALCEPLACVLEEAPLTVVLAEVLTGVPNTALQLTARVVPYEQVVAAVELLRRR